MMNIIVKTNDENNSIIGIIVIIVTKTVMKTIKLK
jgi:hypothetical protein